MYIGYKLYKKNKTNKNYVDMVVWCNANNAHIEDKGTYYEVVENISYVLTIQEQIQMYEKKIEILNNKIVRDLIILNDINSSAKDKEQAQTYFDNKMVEKNKLIQKINELKNSSKGE